MRIFIDHDPARLIPCNDVTEINIGINVWNRFPKRLLTYCEAGNSAMTADRRSMVSMLADYMIFELKDNEKNCR